MILTDDEMGQVRESIEAQARLDEELMRRCGHLIHLGAFDEAVRSAFVLLEERLRRVVGEQHGMTGTQLASFAFNPTNGPLSKHLAHNLAEREGLRELFAGAFKLYRNPTAHGAVDYSAAEAKTIVGLVDLLLRILRRAEELPPPALFPENVENALAEVDASIGPGSASRLRTFLGKCIRIGMRPTGYAQWIGFRAFGLVQFDHWNEPKPHAFAVFYLLAAGLSPGLLFPVNDYYAYVVGFNVDRLTEDLAELGFRPAGKKQEPRNDCAVTRRFSTPFFSWWSAQPANLRRRSISDDS